MSDFWMKKMRTYFQRIDFDKDGAVTRSDFEAMAQRFKESGKLSEGHAQHLMDALCKLWDENYNEMAGGQKLDETAFIAAMNKLAHEPSLKENLQRPLPLFFSAVDDNEDGFISQDEYKLFFSILGLDPNMAPSSFQAIDTNNDGLLSKEEFLEAGTDFFTSEDAASPNKLFWGPLV